MNLKSASLTLVMLLVIGLATLSAPAQSQTDPAPEATPEPIQTARLVLDAQSRCTFTPDESGVVVSQAGVYDLGDASLRFPLDRTANGDRFFTLFIRDGAAVVVQSDGIYDMETGAQLFDLPDESAAFFIGDGDDHYLLVTSYGPDITTAMLYDAATFEQVFPTFEYETDKTGGGLGDPSAPMPSFSGITLAGGILITFDRFAQRAGVYDFASQELLYTRTIEERTFTIDPTYTYIAVSGEDVRTLRENTPVLDGVPLRTADGKGRHDFSTDGSLFVMETPDGLAVLALPSGDLRLEVPRQHEPSEYDFASEFRFSFSDDGSELTVTEMVPPDPRIPDGAGVQYEPHVYDTATGELKDTSTVDETFSSPMTSPDGRFYATLDGIYETATDELVVALQPDVYNGTVFSEDGALAVRAGDGTYDLIARRKLYDLPNDGVNISPDGRYVWSRARGILDARSGDVLASTTKGNLAFSPQSRYAHLHRSTSCQIFALPGTPFALDQGIALHSPESILPPPEIESFTVVFDRDRRRCTVTPDESAIIFEDGVYDLATGALRFPVNGRIGAFSRDGTLVAIRGDGVYDLTTGERRFSIHSGYGIFWPGTNWLVMPEEAIYDTTTGEVLLALPDVVPNGWTMPDILGGSRYIRWDDGETTYLAETETWQIVYQMPGQVWFITNREGTLLAVPGVGVTDTVTGEVQYPLSDSVYVGAGFDPSSSYLLVQDGGKIAILEARTGATISEIAKPDGAEMFIGRWLTPSLIAVSISRVADDSERSEFRTHVYEALTGEPRYSIPLMGARADEATSTLRMDDGSVYDLETGALLEQSDFAALRSSVHQTRDGRYSIEYEHGVIENASGEVIFPLDSNTQARFSGTGGLLTITTRNRCTVYRMPES